MRTFKRIIIPFILVIIISLAFIAGLLYHGIILFNNPSTRKYPVRGVDVSSYQGEINWEILSRQNIRFAYIKATEGSSHTDRYFQSNFKDAFETELRVGAYHFFSFDSSGTTQAENFISTVPKEENMLPPVVDLEFYGDKEYNLPDQESVKQELTALLAKLTEHYGLKPVIYATEKTYSLYLSGNCPEYDIWIRNVFTSPKLSDGRAWTFWQYTNREQLDGYSGSEKYIDMNVFYGSIEEFDNYGKQAQCATAITWAVQWLSQP